MSQAVVPPTPAATIAAVIALPLVSGALVALRFYSKRVMRTSLYVEDWFTIPAFFLVLGMGICLIYGVIHKALAYTTPQPANPKDLPTFVAPEITINRQLEYVVLMSQIPCITCIKLAFLFFYKRIFCTPHRTTVTHIIWFFIIICSIWGISFFFSFIFICGTRPSALWGPLRDFKQHCSHILDWNMVMSTSDFALDVVIFIFPMPLLWSLQMSTTRKFAVLAVFMVGGLTLAASITRMVIFTRAVRDLRKAYKPTGTGSQNLIITAGLYWTTFECGMGLIAACLPPAYGLIKILLQRNFGFKTTASSKPGRRSGGTLQREAYTEWNGSESDVVPLGAPVVRTDIRVDIETVNEFPKQGR